MSTEVSHNCNDGAVYCPACGSNDSLSASCAHCGGFGIELCSVCFPKAVDAPPHACGNGWILFRLCDALGYWPTCTECGGYGVEMCPDCYPNWQSYLPRVPIDLRDIDWDKGVKFVTGSNKQVLGRVNERVEGGNKESPYDSDKLWSERSIQS
jgi:hypothetical protein